MSKQVYYKPNEERGGFDVIYPNGQSRWVMTEVRAKGMVANGNEMIEMLGAALDPTNYQPYGQYKLVATPQPKKPNSVWVGGMTFHHDDKLPLTTEQFKTFRDYMIEKGTDILTRNGKFFTINGTGDHQYLTPVEDIKFGRVFTEERLHQVAKEAAQRALSGVDIHPETGEPYKNGMFVLETYIFHSLKTMVTTTEQ